MCASLKTKEKSELDIRNNNINRHYREKAERIFADYKKSN